MRYAIPDVKASRRYCFFLLDNLCLSIANSWGFDCDKKLNLLSNFLQ